MLSIEGGEVGDRYDLENALLEVEREARAIVENDPQETHPGLLAAIERLDATRERIRQERSTT